MMMNISTLRKMEVKMTLDMKMMRKNLKMTWNMQITFMRSICMVSL
jgi:hypothetical protein